MPHLIPKSQMVGCSWGVRAMALIMAAFLHWTTTRSGYASVTAAASVKRPGEMEPKSISILIGDNATVTCRLFDANSSKIWFFVEKTKRQIRQPHEDITILDSHTALLTIRNAVEQKSRYHCMIGHQAIGVAEVYVGTRPLNVTDFSCRVYDYDFMECSFTSPQNMLLTQYDLEYRTGSTKMSEFVKVKLSRLDNDDRYYCNLTDNYYPVRDVYTFKLTASNEVGVNVQDFVVKNHEIVIPAKLKVELLNVTTNSMMLYWEKCNIRYYQGLNYEIRLRELANPGDWYKPKVSRLRCHDATCRVVIEKLNSYWSYEVRVRVRANTTDVNDENMWSEPFTEMFRTNPRRPDSPPETPIGSFYIDNAETQLRLYWGPVPEQEQNGPGFRYVITEMDGYGTVINRIESDETTVGLPWKRDHYTHVYSVKSANDLGETESGSVIRVYPVGSAQYEVNENSIAKVYHNSSYTLSWQPPANTEELLNYTVFWCLPKIELPNQCKGPISYKYLDKRATNFTTKPQDRSLNLAISANYPHYNKGMQWARCSGDVSSELMKMEPEVTVLNATSLSVKWSSGSVCASILKGYNLTYCRVADNDDTSIDHCAVSASARTIELLRKHKEYRNYTITGLPPYTKVCVSMFMYSPTKRGRTSDAKCVKTRAAAPTPPRNLKVIPNSITSKSAVISWMPPAQNNGELSNYTIYWRKSVLDAFDKNTTSINQTSYTLTSLNSYSDYEIYVTAHTVEESNASNRINISTLIGIPSNPLDVKTNKRNQISWKAPTMPSGRVDFYAVALVRLSNEVTDSRDTVFEKISIVRGCSCIFHIPDCLSVHHSYTLKVRAINTATKVEIDNEIEPMTKSVILSGGIIDQRFCVEEADRSAVSDLIFDYSKENYYFASPWSDSTIFNCPGTPLFAYAIVVIFLVFILVIISYWLQGQYKKMKNIEVILPEGLIDHNKFGNTSIGGLPSANGCAGGVVTGGKKERIDISGNNDFLVAFGNNKENHHLLTGIYKGPAVNGLSSLESNNSNENRDDQTGEHPSLETTNEELSSHSNTDTSSEYQYDDRHRHHHHQQPDLYSAESSNRMTASTGGDLEFSDGQQSVQKPDTAVAKAVTTPGGYVTPSTLLLASNIATTEGVTASCASAFPTLTNGYLQANAVMQLLQQPSEIPQPPINADGYTTLEALEKVRLQPPTSSLATAVDSIFNPTDPSVANRTFNKLPNSAVCSALDEATNEQQHANSSPTDSNVSNQLMNSSNNNNNNNNNNNDNSNVNNNKTIYGYVTQRQLANFGTNVALKEINK